MTSTLSMAARNFLLLVGGLFMVVLSSPKMSLVVLVVVPLVVVPLIFMGRRLKDASRLAQTGWLDVGVEAEETPECHTHRSSIWPRNLCKSAF